MLRIAKFGEAEFRQNRRSRFCPPAAAAQTMLSTYLQAAQNSLEKAVGLLDLLTDEHGSLRVGLNAFARELLIDADGLKPVFFQPRLKRFAVIDDLVEAFLKAVIFSVFVGCEQVYVYVYTVSFCVERVLPNTENFVQIIDKCVVREHFAMFISCVDIKKT